MTTPRGLGDRGRALWTSLARSENTADGVLAMEACRAADRLDELDRIIHGDGVLDLLRFRLVDDEGTVAEVKFDNVLAEARQQQNVLRQMLVTLAGKDGAGRSAAPTPAAQPPASAVDEFTKRRQGRAGA